MMDCVEDEHYDQQECRRNCKVKAVTNILPQRFIPKLIIIIIITTINISIIIIRTTNIISIIILIDKINDD